MYGIEFEILLQSKIIITYFITKNSCLEQRGDNDRRDGELILNPNKVFECSPIDKERKNALFLHSFRPAEEKC